MNIKEALEYGINLLKENKIEEPILKSRIILAILLNKNKEYLILHESVVLENKILEKYKQSIGKLLNHIPLQYITNKQEFMGLDFYVDENVLIPQPDTEILVEEVINIIKKENKINVLDLCTGSGAIGISIAKNIENVNLVLSDISNKALMIAKTNYNRLVRTDFNLKGGQSIKFIESDIFQNIKRKFDIIVSNPPYIKSNIIKTLEEEVKHEPKIALDGGKDGLEFYKKIIKEAYNFLNKDGYLCLEIGYDQKDEVIELINKEGKYKEVYYKKDFSGNDRAIFCKKIVKKAL